MSFLDQPAQFWSSSNDISALVAVGADLWATTSGGVVRWTMDGRSTVFTAADGLASQNTRGIAVDATGRIFVGHADTPAFSMYDGQWHAFPDREACAKQFYDAMLGAPVHDVRLWSSRPGSTWLWMPRHDGRVEAYDGTRWRIYGSSQGVRPGVWMVDVSPEGQVWAVGQSVSTVEEGELYWEDHDLFTEISSFKEITGMAVDSAGDVWLSFAADLADAGRVAGPAGAVGGVARFNRQLNRWEGYLSEMNAAIPSRVYGILMGEDNATWLAGQEMVTHRNPRGPWKATAVPGVIVRAVVEAGDRLWLGAPDGLWSLARDGSDLRGPWRVASPLLDSNVTGLALNRQGRLIVGTPRGASMLDRNGLATIVTREPVFSIAAGPDGGVYLATAAGIYREQDGVVQEVDNTSGQPVAVDVNGKPVWYLSNGRLAAPGSRLDGLDILKLAGAPPRDLAASSDGTLWLALPTGVGAVSDGGQLSVVSGEEALLSPDVRAVAVGPEGLLWVGTAKGLARRQPTGKWTRFTTQSTGGGLRSMDVRDVYADDAGSVWIATSAGISRRTAESDWTYYDVPNARHVLPDPWGVVWVGTASGLYRIQMSALVAVP